MNWGPKEYGIDVLRPAPPPLNLSEATVLSATELKPHDHFTSGL